MSDRAGKGTVGTDRHRIGVGRNAVEAVPVLEVTQLRGVDLVYHFSVKSFAVAAAPKAVFRLDNEVHIRHLPCDRHGSLLRECRRENTRHDNVVVPAPHNDHSIVEIGNRLVCDTRYLNAVALLEGSADTRRGDLDVGRRDTHPHSARRGILLEAVRSGRGIKPIVHILRI